MYHVSNVLSTIQLFKIDQESVNKQIKQLKKKLDTFDKKAPKNKKMKQNKLTKNFETVIN